MKNLVRIQETSVFITGERKILILLQKEKKPRKPLVPHAWKAYLNEIATLVHTSFFSCALAENQRRLIKAHGVNTSDILLFYFSVRSPRKLATH